FNAEFRFPLFAAILPGPLPVVPLYNIQGSAFLDAGAIWGGKGADTRFNVFREDAEGERVFDDVLAGAGFGLRTILLGYPMRIDYAWPYDGRRFGNRQVYFSIGLDF
ncbi:MAG: BamA/TamA family outer membrane protein, partial [Rhodothermales bacterium]